MIEKRKEDHINICLKEDVEAYYNYWDDVNLIHSPIPRVDLEDVDLTTRLLGVELQAPIIIEAMTGGSETARTINRNLAIVAEEFGIGLGVGSQRAAIENPDLEDTYSVVKEYEIPLRIGNLGAPQFVAQGDAEPYGEAEVERAMEMIDAHALAIHFNYLQEIIQPEGDHRAGDLEAALRKVARRYPLIAKETGAGFDAESAFRVRAMGFRAIDVAGAGGTSFAAVEYYRARACGDVLRERLGEIFREWGIPAPVSLTLSRAVGLDIIASGGIRHGLDVARALVLGAHAGGLARALLPAAVKDVDALRAEMEAIIASLRAAVFLSGAGSVEELRKMGAKGRYVITGKLREWMEQV